MDIKEKMKNILSTLTSDVQSYCKEYAAENISVETKKERIQSSLDIARLRANQTIDDFIKIVSNALEKERINPSAHARIKDSMFEDM